MENERIIEISSKISGNIKRIMKEKNISVDNLAKMLDSPKCAVRIYLSGVYNFKLSDIARIEKKLNAKIFI